MIDRTALVLIDVQKGFDDPKWGERNNVNAEKVMEAMLHFARTNEWDVVHVQHASVNETSPLHPTKEGFELKACVAPLAHEKKIQKTVNSAFIGTDLEDYLRNRLIENVVLIGLTTPHCVSTTARMSGNLGFNTFIVEDATAAFSLTDHRGYVYPAEIIHQVTLAALHREFARVISAEELREIVLSQYTRR
ncbi:cysteine hydrolase family protein [Solibacillus sp. FSL H8-0538]|uniref:cysteine hydrolase family protein n=1 Tax=Solibacillus sp. FSL H8-0538 TaxID=2921400 RepID=UPI0030FCD9BE